MHFLRSHSKGIVNKKNVRIVKGVKIITTLNILRFTVVSILSDAVWGDWYFGILGVFEGYLRVQSMHD